MRRIAILLLSVVSLVTTTELVQGKDGCGEFGYWNGSGCAPLPGSNSNQNSPRYGARGYDQPIYGQSTFGVPEIWYRVHFRNGQPYCIQRGYTVQDGICKSYAQLGSYESFPPPAYGSRGYDQPINGRSTFGVSEIWYRPHYRGGQAYCIQRGYTVQDGICKRYYRS